MVAVATITLVSYHRALTEPAADPELPLLRRALAERGVSCEVVDWRTASDLSGSDLVVVKSPWDYADRSREFIAWLDLVEGRSRVVNHPAVIRWNLDKRYLGELAGCGVRVCPTVYCRTLGEARTAIAAQPGRVVVKPTASASSANTGLFESDDPAAPALGRQILGLGKEVMVQPALESVGRVGERSLVHFGGRFVHAVGRGPLLAVGGGLLAHPDRVVGPVPVRPEPDEIALAGRALAAAAELLAGHGVDEVPVHARVDLARDAAGRPVLVELELFEPSLFLGLAPGAERLYVDALLARLEA